VSHELRVASGEPDRLAAKRNALKGRGFSCAASGLFAPVVLAPEGGNRGITNAKEMSHQPPTSPLATRRSQLCAVVVLLLMSALGCGYHTVGGRSSRLPPDLHTIAIPAFQNTTTTYHIEQVLTEAVVREFAERTQYRVVTRDDGGADAALHGAVLYVGLTPLTSDSQTGRLASAQASIVVKISLVDRHGKVLFDNPGYSFHQEYELSRNPSNFFQEESPALDRLARDFARTLVSNVLEAY